MRRLFGPLLAIVIGVSIIPGVARAQTESLPGGCAPDENATVRVLLLIDQSGSLARTDPDDQRITGARAVVRSYASLAERVQQVEIQVAGFGEDYRPGEWQVLDQDSLGTALETVDAVGSVEDQFHTDYVYALDGAASAFEGSTATCQILFWFTDGQHDLDEDLIPAGGLERFYFPQPVTPDNVVEAESLMPSLVCDAGGYAHVLGDSGVSAQIMLLGDESGVDEASRRVLRGMGGDPSLDCGPGNGAFQSVDDASRLPFIMACVSQVGGYQLPGLAPDAAGNLTVNEGVVDGGPAPYQLATEVRLITRGSVGNPPSLTASSLSDVAETTDGDSGTNAALARPVGAPFSIEMSGVTEVCGFVVAQPAVPVVQGAAPTLYQNEPGEFVVVADGPHGRLEGDALGRIQVTADSGQVGSPDGTGWPVTVPTLPVTESFDLTVEMTSVPGLIQNATQTFMLNEQINAPAIVEQPSPVSGEGVGPFLVDLQVDPKDGGELCLLNPVTQMTDAQGVDITAFAAVAGGECVQVEPGGMQTVTMEITLDRSGFAHDVLEFETFSTPSTSPDRAEGGLLAIDLEVTPKANPILVAMIVAGLMLLMLALLWAILYGVNRLIGRIPDPRRNRIRYANFVAELTPTEYGELEMRIVEAPVDSAFRLPKRTPARLDAGSLRMERIVSVVPWVAPYARIGIGTDLVGAHQGPGLPGRIVVAEKTYRGRARDALGPLVTIGLSNSQLDRLAEGTAQKAPGVLLFDIRTARGADASKVAADMISDSLGLIAAEISTRHLVAEMERTGDT
jgi:hypothetical protein